MSVKGENKRRILLDVCIILLLVLISALLFVLLRVGADEGRYVRVTVYGEEVLYVPLSEDATYSVNGGTNTLCISDGEVYMSHADCPDGLCVKMGRIKLAGSCIVCLPNGVEVSVCGGDSSEVDFER